MTRLIRWDPMNELTTFENRFNQLIGNRFKTLLPTEFGEELTEGAWNPAVDVVEEENSYVVKVELAGVPKENIDIDIKDRILTLQGEKKKEVKEEKEDYLRVERSFGKFLRTFTLPENIDEENIGAKFKDGVLELTLPKKEEEKPKKISINVN